MIFETFRENRLSHGNEAAFLVTSGDRSLPITWRQFTDDIAAIAYILAKHRPGGTIGLIGENSYEWAAVHAAIILSGGTVVPVDVNLTPLEIAERLRFVGASVLLHSSLYAEKAHAAARLMPGLSTGGFGSVKTDVFLLAARMALKAGAKSVWDGEAPDPRRISMIVFTSGTTSRPRGAQLTIEGIESFANTVIRRLGVERGKRSLMLLPLHHIFGICTMYLMLARGVALGVCPDFRRIYDAVERFRVNFIFLVPALAEIFAMKVDQHGRSVEEAIGQPVDWILIGGAPMSRRAYEHLTALGVRVLSGYGLTETTALYSIHPLDGDIRVGSAGLVSDEPGVETKVSSAGELLIRGPSIMKGYYKEPEMTAQAIDAEGWFHTGDLGRIDDDGFVWITGRASRTIVLSSGKKIAPEELEEAILALPGVCEVLVSGVGETREVKAEIYASVPEASARKAVAALNLSLPVYKRIKTVVVRSQPFPRTSSGKIRVN